MRSNWTFVHECGSQLDKVRHCFALQLAKVRGQTRRSWVRRTEIIGLRHQCVPTFLTSHSLVGKSHSLRTFGGYRCDVRKHRGKVCIGRSGTSPAVSKSAWVRAVHCSLHKAVPCRELWRAHVLQG